MPGFRPGSRKNLSRVGPISKQFFPFSHRRGERQNRPPNPTQLVSARPQSRRRLRHARWLRNRPAQVRAWGDHSKHGVCSVPSGPSGPRRERAPLRTRPLDLQRSPPRLTGPPRLGSAPRGLVWALKEGSSNTVPNPSSRGARPGATASPPRFPTTFGDLKQAASTRPARARVLRPTKFSCPESFVAKPGPGIPVRGRSPRRWYAETVFPGRGMSECARGVGSPYRFPPHRLVRRYGSAPGGTHPRAGCPGLERIDP